MIEPMEPTEFFTCYRYPNHPLDGCAGVGPKSIRASTGARRPRHSVPSCGFIHLGEEAAQSHQDQLEKIELGKCRELARARGLDPDREGADVPFEWLWFLGRADGQQEYFEEFYERVNATMSPAARNAMREIGRQAQTEADRRGISLSMLLRGEER